MDGAEAGARAWWEQELGLGALIGSRGWGWG